MLAPDMLLLQLGFALLAAALVARRLDLVRLLVGGAALAWLLRAALWTDDWATIGWTGAILLLCGAVLARGLWIDRAVRFTDDERAMIDGLFGELPTSRARHLVDQGLWLTGRSGDELTHEGEPVDHLYYLAEGEARVLVTGRQVGTCRAGDLIGELTVLSGEPASATVVLAGPARFWCAAADDLRPYVEAHRDVRRAIEHGFATVLKAKLRASNRAIAEAGGVAPAA